MPQILSTKNISVQYSIVELDKANQFDYNNT